MRKKSHISLAMYLVEDLKVPLMTAHRKAFYLGNILPDCRPSFLTQRHEFEGTFDMVKEKITVLTQDAELVRRNARAYMRHLGEVLHYLADYFTFPHNHTYDGNLKEHCSYEKDLKFRLREYVKSGQAFRERIETKHFDSVEAIFTFVQTAHDEYLSMKRSVEEDCQYIVRVCHQVVQAILHLINENKEKRLCLA